MRDETLLVILDGREMGRIDRDARGQPVFRYDGDWRSAPDTIPLSVSMPLASVECGPDKIEPFLWGLLPDNEGVLDRWARKWQISKRNAMGLLAHVGEDCAGAIQLLTPERFAELQDPQAQVVDWLTLSELAERLRLLRTDHAAGRLAKDLGQFSLGGALPKTALYREGTRWGVPRGRLPTTHILKPPLPDLDGHAENEHLCLSLARALNLRAARSEVLYVEGEVAIVVERFDRLRVADLVAQAAKAAGEAMARSAEAATRSTTATGADERARAASEASAAHEEANAHHAAAERLRRRAATTPVLRVHQEDLCQAHSVPPAGKYQADGGPKPDDVAALLRDHSADPAADIRTFIDALVFNWLIVGTDAHAKNYALLHRGRNHIRLAPLYDLGSILPYPEINHGGLKLAMKVGGEYRVRNITRHHWEKLAKELRVDPDDVVARARTMADRLPDELATLCDRHPELSHPIVPRLRELVTEHAIRCQQILSR